MAATERETKCLNFLREERYLLLELLQVRVHEPEEVVEVQDRADALYKQIAEIEAEIAAEDSSTLEGGNDDGN